MQRLIFTSPADLPEELAEALSSTAAPMPGTVAVGGTQVVDALAPDGPLPDVELLGAWTWDEAAPDLTELQALDMDAYMAFVPDVIEYDDSGEPIGSHPAPRQLTHNWAGWPEVAV